MLSKKLILPSLATLLLFNHCLIADEIAQENPEALIEEHVPVRSREMDPERRALKERLKAQEAAEAEENEQADISASMQKANYEMNTSSTSQFMFAPRQVASYGATGARRGRGATGATGATGAYGFYKTNAAYGSYGATGATGASGSSRRANGATGATGASGFYNTNTAYGSYGATGATGTSGSSYRASGATGATGATIAPRGSRPHGFPINCHWLISIGDSYRTIELEDGSHWDIASVDNHTLRNWRRDDSLSITPNGSWLSAYDYYITNKTNNSYVKANLRVGPLAHGAYSHWVVGIDHLGGHVQLENGMVWCVDPQDGYLLKEWVIDDHIVLGQYDSWFSPFNHILINVSMDNFIHVKQY